MSKLALIGIFIYSLFMFSGKSPEIMEPNKWPDHHSADSYVATNTLDYNLAMYDCTVTTHGYINVDGVLLYINLTVEGPCDASIVDKVRAAIRELRGIK